MATKKSPAAKPKNKASKPKTPGKRAKPRKTPPKAEASLDGFYEVWHADKWRRVEVRGGVVTFEAGQTLRLADMPGARFRLDRIDMSVVDRQALGDSE